MKWRWWADKWPAGEAPSTPSSATAITTTTAMSKRPTLWHSGLLLILLCGGLVVLSEAGRIKIDDEVIEDGRVVAASEVGKLKCESFGQEPAAWRLDGIPLDNLVQAVVGVRQRKKLECSDFVSTAFVFLDGGGDKGNNNNNSGKSIRVLLLLMPGETLEVNEGEAVKIECDAVAGPGARMTWFKNGRRIQDLSTTRYEISPSSLTVLSAEKDDSGNYSCQTSTGNEAALTVNAHEDINNAAIDFGSDFAAGCEVELPASDDSSTRIEWEVKDPKSSLEVNYELVGGGERGRRRRGDKIRVREVRGELLLRCSAGSAKSDFARIRVKSEPPQIARIEGNPVVSEGSPLWLKCVSYGKPEPTVKWIRGGGGSFEFRGGDSLLRIPSASPDDAGVYRCVAENPLGMEEASVKVKVISSSLSSVRARGQTRQLLVLAVNHSLAFDCAREFGRPGIRPEWRKDGKRIEKFSGAEVLRIEKVSREDAGKYACEVEEGSSIEWTLVVTTAAGSRVKRAVEESPSSSSETVAVYRAGEAVKINCSNVDNMSGAAEFSWYRNGELLPEAESDVLEIPYLRREHSGEYVCQIKAKDEDGADVQNRHFLKVLSAEPKIDKDGIGAEMNVFEGGNVVVNCQMSEEGIPKAEVLWKKANITHLPNPLSISGASRSSDEGIYTCLAVNEYGSDRAEVEIRVLDRIKFVRPPKDTLADSLEQVTLECGVQADQRIEDQTRIEWFFDGESIDDDDMEVTSSGSLFLSSALKRHEGTYTCSASDGFESINRTARLTVLGEQPSFMSTERDARTLEGGNLTLSCQANGLPMPEIHWTRDGSSVPLGLGVVEGGRFVQATLGDLLIIGISTSDQGEYKCVASNIYGHIEHVTRVEVIRRAAKGMVSSQREILRNVRDRVSFRCEVSYDPRLDGETEFGWTKDGAEVVEGGKIGFGADKSLNIRDLALEDGGIYVCKVATPFETVSGPKISLRMSGEPPKILSNLKKTTIHEGEEISLKCLVRGVPRPELQWLFNGEPLEGDFVRDVPTASDEFRESRIEIPSASKESEGVYQCETSNTYGSGVAKFAKVNVIKRTKATIGRAKEMLVDAGQNLKIPCTFSTDPLNRVTNIIWTKDEQAIEIGANDRIDFGMDGSVIISDVQRRHEGSYRCTVVTVMDNSTDSVAVKVVVNAPFIASHSDERQIVFGGEEVRLECKANGIPQPEVSWTFNKTKTDVKGEQYLITKAIISDSGKYVCTARNLYGETRQSMSISVVSIPRLKSEYLVKTGDHLELPCVPSGGLVKAEWMKNGVSLNNATISSATGKLIMSDIAEGSAGVYSCVIRSVETEKKMVLQTVVTLKPRIIIGGGKRVVDLEEGDDLSLDCDVLSGVEAKRLWKFEGDFFLEGGRRDVRERGGVLTVDKVAPEDSGTYTCLAVTSFGRDTVDYLVRVREVADGSAKAPAAGCDSNLPANVREVLVIDNSTVEISWTMPPVNSSCFTAFRLSWWTNETNSRFFEKDYSTVHRSGIISGLSVDLGYYVQVNLVTKDLGKVVYGQTRAFTVSEASRSTSDAISKGEEDSLLAGSALLVLALVITVLILLFLSILAIYLKKRSSAKTVKDNGRRSITISGPIMGNNHNDFMQNLTPQWPEPEPSQPPHEDDAVIDETEVFIRGNGHHHHQQPQQNRHHNNRRTSISSSWSSLFNVPTQDNSNSSVADCNQTASACGSGSVRSSVLSSSASGGRGSYAGVGRHHHIAMIRRE